MNRQEFMKRLEELLRGIPASEREDALAYYNDYFDEAGAENEAQVIRELGSPEAVAENILSNIRKESYFYEENQTNSNADVMKVEKKKMSKSTKILLIILLVFTFPLWIGIVAGAFGTIIGLIGIIFAIVVSVCGAAFGLTIGGIICMIGGLLCVITAPVEGLISMGVGAILTAVGLLLGLLGVWSVGVWIPKLVKAIVKLVKRLFHRKKGGNEL